MKRYGLIPIICFLLIAAAVVAGFAVSEQREWSDSENRELAMAPSRADFKGDPDGYAKAFETYLSDQFPFRETLVAAYTAFQEKTGRWYVRGVRVMRAGTAASSEAQEPAAPKEPEKPVEPARVDPPEPGEFKVELGADPLTVEPEPPAEKEPFVLDPGYLFLDSYRTTDGQRLLYKDALARLCAVEGLEVADIILPHKNYALAEGSGGVFTEAADAENLEARKALDEAAGAAAIDACSPFNAYFPIELRAKFYYMSDIHWNMRGAFHASHIAAQGLAEAGIISASSVPLSGAFAWEELGGDHSFSGDLGRRFGKGEAFEELIPRYYAKNTENWSFYTGSAKTGTARDEVVGSGLSGAVLDYNKIGTYNQIYLRVENPDAPEKRNVLVLKDSYACAAVDYLASIFTSVTMLDPRYELPPLSKFIEEEGIDLVLLMYHQNNTMKELSDYIDASY
jgi:hypothetical protein